MPRISLNPAAAIFLALLAFGLVGPLLVYPVFLMKVMCFALFASAFNLLIGYVGLLAFGHAMFFGGAAYVTGYLLKVAGWPAEVSILAGATAAAVLGVITGLLAIGRQGIYFAMITLALAQMFFFFCVQAPFTGGENGLTAIPRGHLFGLLDLSDDVSLYYVVFAIVASGIFLIYRTIHSPFGQVLKGIRDNEPRAISLGYDVNRFKLIAFTISAFVSGLAGALKAIVLQLATLVDVSWTTSGEVVLMTLMGGIGTVVGPILGAAVIITMQNYLTGFAEWVVTIQGLVFFFTVLIFRRGIAGEAERIYRNFRLRAVSPPRSEKTGRQDAVAPRNAA
ncbi:branched-chain amino acid ABC transporter permease [Bradyrhizobium sp. LHD-71]|uniref:branched-chain amino acid ABC transporter permease n=1 Tax=Bradyrhizobium sp. LHD-71 TaxID=3072141 RepID=UPI00280F74C5|nr:branched-chain amino acid ABC transporter permease [Bradyrhizobium sp. LHD-71]MDQ8731956.1 branched-chain amino acid ABC transporter permease [Bradyrhizobium sp. LHD-71]